MKRKGRLRTWRASSIESGMRPRADIGQTSSCYRAGFLSRGTAATNRLTASSTGRWAPAKNQ